MATDSFWDAFYRRPLDQIPWQNTQADWFKKLVDEGKVNGESALDLGCGTGMKSTYLAQHGFSRVIGMDISAQAIAIAKENAEKAGVSDKCAFFACDLGGKWALPDDNEKFDFILDWAMLHGLPSEKRPSYAQNIDKHSRKGSRFLIRAFGTTADKESFEESIDGVSVRIHFLSEDDVTKLFPNFSVLERNRSLPRTKTDGDIFLTELLMEKKA